MPSINTGSVASSAVFMSSTINSSDTLAELQKEPSLSSEFNRYCCNDPWPCGGTILKSIEVRGFYRPKALKKIINLFKKRNPNRSYPLPNTEIEQVFSLRYIKQLEMVWLNVDFSGLCAGSQARFFKNLNPHLITELYMINVTPCKEIVGIISLSFFSLKVYQVGIQSSKVKSIYLPVIQSLKSIKLFSLDNPRTYSALKLTESISESVTHLDVGPFMLRKTPSIHPLGLHLNQLSVSTCVDLQVLNLHFPNITTLTFTTDGHFQANPSIPNHSVRCLNIFRLSNADIPFWRWLQTSFPRLLALNLFSVSGIKFTFPPDEVTLPSLKELFYSHAISTYFLKSVHRLAPNARIFADGEASYF
ncbi:hypothetical protein DSO57_1008216 [Entomophthora muscae]|uniref:Uncharacterized protein n=1 Tax=Entomophthora muscae TaxID=34485 RepID=A0ACC2SW13_9FUNG|nr:hypothetical protein DSO57_1008216 [Entomophthora muscae]